MALAQAAAVLERVIGHNDNSETAQDVTNPAVDRKKYADPSGETMQALLWMGKNTVKVRKSKPLICRTVRYTFYCSLLIDVVM